MCDAEIYKQIFVPKFSFKDFTFPMKTQSSLKWGGFDQFIFFNTKECMLKKLGVADFYTHFYPLFS